MFTMKRISVSALTSNKIKYIYIYISISSTSWVTKLVDFVCYAKFQSKSTVFKWSMVIISHLFMIHSWRPTTKNGANWTRNSERIILVNQVYYNMAFARCFCFFISFSRAKKCVNSLQWQCLNYVQFPEG